MSTNNLARKCADVKSSRADFPFLMLPGDIASDVTLSPGAKLLYGAILSLSKASWGSCKARNETLARMVGLSVIQVRRLLQALEERGLIERIMAGTVREEIRAMYQIDARLSIKTIQGGASKRCGVQHQIDAPDKTSQVEKKEESASVRTGPQAARPSASEESDQPFDREQFVAMLAIPPGNLARAEADLIRGRQLGPAGFAARPGARS
jgi:hypothetical protein